jgi:renalase
MEGVGGSNPPRSTLTEAPADGGGFVVATVSLHLRRRPRMSRVLVVGAGIAGLLAAHRLQELGHEATVLDKSHRPGGRMATRRVGDATFDIGAQFLTVRDTRFAAHVERWQAAGHAEVWFRGAPDERADTRVDGHPRFRGTPSMRAIPEHLGRGVDLRLARRVTGIATGPGGWRVRAVARQDPTDDEELLADALVCAAPVPQVLELLRAGGTRLSEDRRRELEGITYAPTLALLAVPRQRPGLGPRGALRLSEGPIAFLSDNHAKGVSDTPAVTIHASEEVSRRRWADGDDVLAGELLRAARAWLGGDAEVVGVHRWRYATPRTDPSDLDAPARVDVRPLPLAFAGDAFAGGRVEGAARSGLAAADLLADALA